jgi:polyadenylate-binding protein
MTTSEAIVAPAVASSAAPAAPAAAASAAATTTASLYVGELSPEVTEAMLFEVFNQIGPVASIRICRDAITRRSLGYGYVNYHNVSDGERALEQLNYTAIKGLPCRIMWSQRDPTMRRSGDGNIFIKNLDASIDNKALHDLFSTFGNILSCKVSLDEAGNSKGYGFVHFEHKEAGEAAIAKINGLLLNDKKVFVGPHVSRKERLAQFEEMKASFTNVFVKNLDEAVDNEELEGIFTPYGRITSALIGIDEATGKSKCFGFVNFAEHEAAERAVVALNGTEHRGRQLYVGRAQKKAERDEELRRQFEALKIERSSRFAGVNLYVKNLSETVDEEKLRAEFTPFGAITSCKVMVDEKGTSRGFGFVCFATADESSRALAEMNGRMIAGKPLYVAFAQRKDERRAQLEAQYSARAQQLRYQQQMAAAAAAAAGYPAGVVPPAPMFFAPMGAGPAGQPRYASAMRPPAGPGAPVMMRPPRPMRTPYQRPPAGTPMGPGPVGPGAYVPRPPRQYAPGPGARPPRRHPGMMMMPPMHMAGPLVDPVAAVPLTAAALASAAPEQQKRMLGERLYPMVAAREPEAAAKITGMLLEMDNAELLHLLDAPEALGSKVQEAVDVLRQHTAAQTAESQ